MASHHPLIPMVRSSSECIAQNQQLQNQQPVTVLQQSPSASVDGAVNKNDNESAHEAAHMAGLLSRRRASETVREFLLTTAEVEHERERRLQVAAVNVVAFRRRCPVAPAIQSHPLFEVYGSGKGVLGVWSDPNQASAFSKVLPAEEEITFRLLKGMTWYTSANWKDLDCG